MIFGGTLTPFKGTLYSSKEGEAKRQAVNESIRTSGAHDAVIDFDAVVRDSSIEQPPTVSTGLSARKLAPPERRGVSRHGGGRRPYPVPKRPAAEISGGRDPRA